MEQSLYDKTSRMILGSKTKEELRASWKFIELVEKNGSQEPGAPNTKDSVESLKKLWFEKDSEIFS